MGVVALLVGGTWTFLETRPGADVVRRIVLPRINARLAGHLGLERFGFAGDHATLDHLVLRDPAGRLVARIERVDVALTPLSLLRRRLDLPVSLRRPELWLVQDAAGTNLGRALANRSPDGEAVGDTPSRSSAGGRLSLEVRRLAVVDGMVDYRREVPGRMQHLQAAVDLTASATLGPSVKRAAVDASIQIAGGLVRVEARAQGDRYELSRLRAVLPGVEVTASGTASADHVDARAQVEASDLAATAASLTPPDGPPPLALAGAGRADLTLGGALGAPSLHLVARLPRLRVGADRVRDLALSATVPDLRRPDAADLDLTAGLVGVGKQALRALALTIRASGPRLTADVRVAAPYPVRLTLSGRRAPTTRALTIDALTLRYPEATWALLRPARLSYGPGLFDLEGLALRADRQRVRADLSSIGGEVHVGVRIEGLDLGRLPRAWFPPSLGLGGTIDLDARLEGDSTAPRLDAKLVLAGGRIRGYRDLSLDLDAHAGPDGRSGAPRARGRITARGLGTSLAGRFDLPAAWPIHDRHAPFHLDVAIGDTDLAVAMQALATAAGRPAPSRVAGRARLTARLDGTADDPRLAVEVGATALTVDGRSVGDLRFNLNADGDRPSEARLAVVPSTSLAMVTPLSLRAALRHRPTPATLVRTPFEVSGNVDRLPLAALARLAGYPSPVGGVLSAQLAVSGTVLGPRGTLTMDVAGVTTGSFPPTDARVEVGVEPHGMDLHVRVVRKRCALLAAEVHVGAGARALRAPETLASAPIQLRAVIGPLALQRLGLPPESDRQPPRVLKGLLHADLAVDGTLRAPRVLAHVDANDIRLDRSLVGVAHLEASYADRRARLDARLVSTNQGQARAVAVASADLGYPAIARGMDLRRLPLDVRVDAQGFDLQGFSGVVQDLRTVGGTLSAAANVRGTLRDPRVSGRVEWSNGLVAMTGFGEYRDIHLSLHGDQDDLVLDELAMRSGAGGARLFGTALHAPGGGYRFNARAAIKSFPVYQEGQPLAAVTVDAALGGTAAPFASRATADLSEARIELSDAKRKDLQSLKVPADVVLVDGGRPLNRQQADRLRALLAARRRAGGLSPAAIAEPAAPPSQRPWTAARLAVNAPRNIWVTGKDAYLELGLGPGFRLSTGDRTQVFGQVIVHRGRIDLFGRRFDLKADSTLEFSGPSDRPELDLTAQHYNRAEDVTVELTAKGPLDHLKIAVSSPARPDLTESQLYALIITGHLQLGGGGSGSASGAATAEAASLLGGVVASQMQKTLGRKLPLDVLTIDSGGGEGLTGTELEAGRYVTGKVYVGYVGRLGADPTRYENRNAVHLEYSLSSRWEIEGEYGDVGTGSADLMWKKSY